MSKQEINNKAGREIVPFFPSVLVANNTRLLNKYRVPFFIFFPSRNWIGPARTKKKMLVHKAHVRGGDHGHEGVEGRGLVEDTGHDGTRSNKTRKACSLWWRSGRWIEVGRTY